MQIRQLHFHPFGPFEDRRLDFSSSPLGLHIVYGHNEAGKSSSLRAISDLLFGFLHKTMDNWQFDNNKLCISADLLLSNDTSLTISRFKRRKNDLVEQNSNEPLDQQVLTRHLGGLDRESFLHTFGISHESLRLGVESILAAGGDLGQTLFAATSGINKLNSLMKALEDKQAALFSPNARKPLINTSIQQIKEASQALREATVSHDEWINQKKNVEDLAAQDKQLQLKLNQFSKDLFEKKRYLKGLEALPSYRSVTKELQALCNIPNLEKGFSQSHIETQTALKEVQQQKSNLEKQLTELGEKLSSLSVNLELLNNRLAIEKAAGEAEVHRKAHNDDQGIRARIHLIHEQILRQLEAIRPGLNLETLEKLKISSVFLQQVQQLHNEKIQLDQQAAHTQQSLHNLDREISRIESALNDTQNIQDITELGRTYTLCVEQASLENLCHELQEEIDSTNHQASGQLLRLGLWKDELKTIIEVPIPLKESVRLFAEKFHSVGQDLFQLNESIQLNEDSFSQLQQHLFALTHGDTVATLALLTEKRKARDNHWNTIKKLWLTPGSSQLQPGEDAETATLLAHSFSSTVETVDKISDELIHNADRTVKIKNIREELKILGKEKQVLEKKKEELVNKQNRKNTAWKALWAPCRISPLSPPEMLSWLDRYQELKNTLENLNKLEHRLAQVTGRYNEFCEKLRHSLQAHMVLPQETGLRQLLGLTKEILDRSQSKLNKKAQFEERLAELDVHKSQLSQQVNNILSSQNSWKARWNSKVAHLDFPEQTATEDIVLFLNSIGELLQQVQSSKELQIRSDAIYRDYKKYTERIQQLDALLATGLSSLAPEEAAYQLHSLLRENLDSQKEQLRLQDERSKLYKNFEQAEEKIVSLQEKLNLLCKQARVSNVAELFDVEEKALQKQNEQIKLENLSAQLSEVTAGQDLEIFFNRIAGLDVDQLTLEIEHLTERQQQILTEHREVVEHLAVAKQHLFSFSSDDDAVILAERIESLRLETEEQVEQYLTLKTASAILVKAIEEYRKHNQNPVLELASDYFRELTEQNFNAVCADFDEKGRPILKAERNDGTRLAIEEMSDGSRDQLFLALRLGGLARHIEKNGPMPFIVDDILIHFDDRRALAALQALHRLGQKNQIIFFTHHQHLVSLCQKLPARSHLQIHTL